MAKMNWARTHREKRAQRNGTEPHEGVLPSAPEGMKLSRKGNEIISARPKSIKAPEKKKTTNPDQARIDLTSFVARSVARGSWVGDKVPASTSRSLAQEVERAGGLVRWAEMQRRYRKLLARAQKREAARMLGASRRQEKVQRPTGTGKSAREKPDGHDEYSGSKGERIQHLKSEIRAAEEFIRTAQKELKRLDPSNF